MLYLFYLVIMRNIIRKIYLTVFLPQHDIVKNKAPGLYPNTTNFIWFRQSWNKINFSALISFISMHMRSENMLI